MPSKVFLNDDNIIEIQVIGDQTIVSIEQMGRQINALLTEQKAVGKPTLLLDDLTQMGKVDADARSKVVELASHLDYDRLAMFGQGGVMRFGTNLMLRATGRGYKAHFFENRAEAVAWLLEKPDAKTEV